MADEEMFINGKPLSSLRVVDLKKECDRRKLSKSGSKSQLMDRLKTDMLLQNLGSDKGASAGAPIVEEECQNEFIKQYLQQQKQLIENTVNSSSQESEEDSPKKTGPIEPVYSQPPPREKRASLSELSAEKHSSSKQSHSPVRQTKAEVQRSSSPETGKMVESKEKDTVLSQPPVNKRSSRRSSDTTDSASNKQEAKKESSNSSTMPERRQSRRSRTSGSEDMDTQADVPIPEKPDKKVQSVKETEAVAEIETKVDEKKKSESVDPSTEMETTEPAEIKKVEESSKPAEKSKVMEAPVSEFVKPEKESPKLKDKSKDAEPLVSDLGKKEVESSKLAEKSKVAEPPVSASVKQEMLSPKPTEKSKVVETPESGLAKPEKESPKPAEKPVEAPVSGLVKQEILSPKPPTEKSKVPEPPVSGVVKPEKESPKPSVKLADKDEAVTGSSDVQGKEAMEVETEQKPETAAVSRKSRSRSKTPPTRAARGKKARSPSSSSSSSDSSRSRSRSKERKSKNKGGRSSSSSRSRSRSPVGKPAVKSSAISSRLPARRDSRSSSSSRSRSRTPSPKRKPVESSRQRSPSPVQKEDNARKTNSVKEDKTLNPETKPENVVEEPMQTEVDITKAATVSVRQASTDDIKPPEAKVSKKISLNRRTIEDAGEADKDKQDEGDVDGKTEDKPAKRRKWGSKSATTLHKPKKASSIPISTESLKGLMPDIKPALKLGPEPILEDEMDYEDDTSAIEQMEAEDTRSVKIQRTVTQDVEVKDNPDSPAGSDSEEGEEEEEEEEDDEGSSEEGADEEEQKSSEGGDSRAVQTGGNKKQEEGADKENQTGSIDDKTDKPTKTIKLTKASEKRTEVKIIRRLDSRSGIVPLIKPDEPEKARRAPSPARNPVSKIVHIRNLVRPFTLPQLKELLKRTGPILDDEFWIDKIKSHCFVTYESEEDAVKTRDALHNTRWPSSNPKTLVVDFGSEEQLEFHRGDEKPIPPKKSADKAAKKDLDAKQEKLKAEREKETERRKIEREKRMKERLEKEEHEKGKPVREWDRVKKTRADWDRTMQRSRSRSPRGRKSRTPSGDRRRERQNSVKEQAEKKEKKEEAQPAKLLDDLFRKTKATPCIYWLPLTEEQIAAKEKTAKAQPVLRQKQEGDKVSPMREVGGQERPERRRRSISPPRRTVRDSPRGRPRMSPDRRRRDEGNDSRSRSGRRR